MSNNIRKSIVFIREGKLSDFQDSIREKMNEEAFKRLEVAKQIVASRFLGEEQNEDGRGRHKVSYTHPDKKNRNNDRFETKIQAIKYANDLKKKGYHDVYIGEAIIDEALPTKLALQMSTDSDKLKYVRPKSKYWRHYKAKKDAKGQDKKTNEDTINELSKETLASYTRKATKDRDIHAKGFKDTSTRKDDEGKEKNVNHWNKWARRDYGINLSKKKRDI